ncbi:MAG: HDIG domain-containing metalloprotein [Cloacibacillus evryensis]
MEALAPQPCPICICRGGADKLHMNGLLVRAGAYYHDIGKLKNPQYFVENQRHGKNIHDSLPPTLSGQLLISHVKEGLDIAAQTNLPKALRRFISEHHGTTSQRYFYEKAKALGENVTEEQFRYPGPRPQSRETALVMLADSVEAAIKARSKPFESNRELSDFINQVIRSKVESNQLNDVDFTMKEMSLITEAFMEVFQATYHSREVKNINEIIKEAKLKGGEQGRGYSPDGGSPLPPRGREKEEEEDDKIKTTIHCGEIFNETNSPCAAERG